MSISRVYSTFIEKKKAYKKTQCFNSLTPFRYVFDPIVIYFYWKNTVINILLQYVPNATFANKILSAAFL